MWNFIDSAPWASPRRGKHTCFWPRHSIYYLLYGCKTLLIVHPEQVPDEENTPVSGLVILFIIYFMDVKLYWQCTPSKSPTKKTHPETGCRLFLIVLFIIYFMDVYFTLTVHPEQVGEKTPLETGWYLFLPLYLLLTIWMWKLYIDSAPWENPPRRRRLTLRLSKEIFSPLYLLLNLWMWNFIYSAPWTSHRRRRPTLRLGAGRRPDRYVLRQIANSSRATR